MRMRFIASALLVLTTLNINAQASVMLGAFVPGNGWNQENISTLNDQLHKKLSFITLFSAFTEDWNHLDQQTSRVASAGMVPMISWMPIDLNRKDINILPEITAGLWDDYLNEWGKRFIAWHVSREGPKHSILLRFGHEFNGNWYSYSDSPDSYKQAYQYIHNLFEELGANEYIEWVWCANNLNIDTVNDITRYYPGDAFVDWTSIDGYNWGTNYSWTKWESFVDVYAETYSTLVTNYPDKPIMIAEYGSAEPTDAPDVTWGQTGDNSDINESKNIWMYDMLKALESSFPAVRAVSLFNINKELGWSITEAGSTGLAGMNLGLRSDYFVSDYITLRAPGKPGTGESEPSIAFAYDGVDIMAEEQQRLARSRVLPSIKRENVERMRRGFLSMSPVGRAQIRELKHSVLDSQ